MNQTIRAYIAEFIGTFTLVFIGTGVATLSGMLNQGPVAWIGIALAFGFTLMVLVLTIGPVSGCHVNPAVTVGFFLSKRMKPSDVLGYFAAQCLGAIAASGVLLILLQGFPSYSLKADGLGANGNPLGLAVLTLFGFELVMTALFVMVILSVTRADLGVSGSKSPAFAGMAIGGFLFVAHLVGVPLGDSSLNPARSLGPAIFQGADALSVLWIFIVGPTLGGVCGAVLYRLIYGD
jgi:aquaporin Z